MLTYSPTHRIFSPVYTLSFPGLELLTVYVQFGGNQNPPLTRGRDLGDCLSTEKMPKNPYLALRMYQRRKR